MADQKVFVRRGSRFYSWLEAKPLELRLGALLDSIINPMQEQEMSRTTITSILRQLSMDCYVSLTPLPQELVQQFTTRTTLRSRSSEINQGVITISSDESDDETYKPCLIGSKRRAINRILSDDDDDDDDDVQVIEDESPPSSVLQTEIQVSIKVCGSGNVQPKLFDLENQEVKPLSLPEHSNKYSSSSSNENDTLSDDVFFEKLSKRKRAKYIACFSEDGDEAPKLKITKLSDNTKKKASLDNEDASSETSDNLGSVNPVLNNKKVRRSTNDCENYSETRPLDECTSKMYPNKNKKQSSHKNGRRKEKCKIRPDVEEEEEPKRRKTHKRRKSSTKENRRNSKSISSATTDNGSSVDSVINHTVGQLWSSFGMESPSERSGNIIKSFPGTTTITSGNNNDTEVQQKQNSTIDKSKIDCLTNEVVSAIWNTKPTVTNIETANQTSSTTFSSPNQNIVESFAATPSNQIISSDKVCVTITSNIGKIRLRDPKTLMKISDDIPDPVPLNAFPIYEASRSTENNEANSVDKPLIPGSINDEQPSTTIHHLPLNKGNEQLSSETNQNQANIVEGHTELENEPNIILTKFYMWYFQQDVEVKCAKMSEILYLVIAAKICRDEMLNRATKLTSKNSFAEEKRRVEREYSDTLRVRGGEFKVLFSDVIESELVLPKVIVIVGIYCKIITGLLRIEETNSKFDLSARSLICEMLKKNGYKNQLVYELFSVSDDHFKSKYRKMQILLSRRYTENPQEMLCNTVLNSERPNISSTETSVNAGYIINLGFDIQNNLEQHIVPQEKASRIPEQQGAPNAHFGAPTISGIEVNHNSVIKHVSSKNNPNISNVDIEYATTSPNLANQSPNTLPISSVLPRTVQEYQQISRTPPAYHGVHEIVQNNHNVARVNPNVSAPHISPTFGRIENENHNYNIQQQALNGQMYHEHGKRVGPVNPQTQLAQQTQNVPKTPDRINYYSHFSKEYQQTVQVQNGYKMLSPQQLQNGRILNTQQNANGEQLAMNPPQYSQGGNIYRRLSSEHQQAEKRQSWQPPIYNTHPGQIQRTHQTSEPIYSVNDQNVKKTTATDYQVTLALRTAEQNNHRQITKPPEIRSNNSVVQASSPEHNNHRQVTKPTEIRNSYFVVQVSKPEQNNLRQVTKPPEIRNSYSVVQASSPEQNNHRQVTKPPEITNSYSVAQASSPVHNNHRQVTKPLEIINSYSVAQASSPEQNNHRQVTKPPEITNSYSVAQASSPVQNNHRQVTKPHEIINSYSVAQASSPEQNNHRQVTKPPEIRNSYSVAQTSSPVHNNHRQVTKPPEIRNSYSVAQASSPEHNNHRQVTKPPEIRNSYSVAQASSPEHNNHRQVTKPPEIRNSYSVAQASSPEHNNHRQVTKPPEIRNSYSVAQASSPDKNNHSQITKTPEIRNSNTAVQENSTNSNSRTNQLNKSQVNTQSEVNNYLKDNPHAISYARLRQTSAIQNHREVKRALVHPMVNKLVKKFNLPERQFTVAPSTNRNIPISPILHNGYTNLYQPPLDQLNPVQSLHNASVETNQKEKEQLSDKLLKNQQTFNPVHGQPNYNQNGQPDKAHLGAFQNVSRNSPAYTSALNQIPEQYFGHPAQHISYMNTLNNATTSQLNQNLAIHQNNVSGQYQNGSFSNTIPPLQRNDKAINSQFHGTTQQNSSDIRNKTLFSLLNKSVNSAEINVAKQNQNSSINTVSPNLQNSVTSGNSKSYGQSILKQQNNDPIKSIYQVQDSNMTVSEYIKAKTALSEAELRYSDKNVPLQNANDKSLAMYYQAKAQLLVQNNIDNVPNQGEDQPCSNSTLTQHQIPSNPRTEINITNILGSSVSASLNVEEQVNAISQQNVHSPISSTRKPMDQSDQTSKIQIHSVHSQSPSVFYKNLDGTNKQQTPCSNINCHKEAKVLCSGCQNACYCSKECQFAHWYTGHHEVCTT